MNSRRSFAIFLALTIIGLIRIASTYRWVAQTIDETPNIACGMQWLDQKRYDYGPFHPPLARIAMAIGPYLYGLRSQNLPDRWKEGNAILHSGKNKKYSTALTLARIGILPFFVLACACVWMWSRSIMGEWGAIAAVFLFTNVPSILAHAGIATTDFALMAGMVAALYAFARWLEKPDLQRSIVFGIALAVAFLTKFSALLFLPICLLSMVALYWIANRTLPSRVTLLAVSAVVAFVVIWAAYRFSWGRMKDPATKAPFTLLNGVPVPAPEILDGIQFDVQHNSEGHPAYLLGKFSRSGWWYFFPVAVGVKTPLALLILAGIGAFAAASRRSWQAWAPVVCAIVILAACMPAHVNAGLRYVLPLFPMLTIAGAMGTMWLFERGRAARVPAVSLLLWMTVSSARAHPDYLAYFNEIAQPEPSRFLVDSDLDWGQDVRRLTWKLKELGVKQMHFACHWSGDDSKLDLPAWEALEPYKPVTGWIAISYATMKLHGLNVANALGRADSGFGWLDKYKPVAKVGKSILIYYIPTAESGTSPDARRAE